MKQKLITSAALAYIVVDKLGWYSTAPQMIVATIGLAMVILAGWTWVEEKKNNHHKKSPRTDQSLGTQK